MTWPAPYDGSRVEPIGAGTSSGTTITAAGSTNTKGSYTQLIAATADPIDLLLITPGAPSAAADYLIDIAIGGAGSEQVIISNLLICSGKASGVSANMPLLLPLSIPAGTRIAARCQATTASATIALMLHGLARGLLDQSGLSRVTTYGANTADSGGTSVDPGASANTKGAWTQIVASTSAQHTALFVAFGNQVNTVRTSGSWLIDIGIGGAGSEQILIADLFVRGSSSNDTVTTMLTVLLPVAIPAGTRISVRAASDITDATDRLIDAAIYGVS